MKAGDVINGYRILEDFKVVGAGLSKWTFAERGGRQYFIKEFLSPTYPDDDAPGSEKIKARSGPAARPSRPSPRHATRTGPAVRVRRKPHRHAGLLPLGCQVLQGHREGRRRGPDRAGIAGLGLRLQLVLMKTVAHSLKILHDLRIVHGDLKPSNILIKRTELGYTSKADRLRQLLHRRQAAAAGRDRRHDQLLLPGAARLHPRGRGACGRTRCCLRHLRPRLDLYRVPDRSAAALRRCQISRTRGGRQERRNAAHPAPRASLPQLADLVDAMLAPEPVQRPTISHVHATLMAMRPVTQEEVGPPPSGALRGKGLRPTLQRSPTTERAPCGSSSRKARPKTT